MVILRMILRVLSLFLVVAFTASPVQGSWIKKLASQLESSCGCQTNQSCCCEVDSENSFPKGAMIKGAGCLCSETTKKGNSPNKTTVLLSLFSINHHLLIEDVFFFYARSNKDPYIFKIEKPPRNVFIS